MSAYPFYKIFVAELSDRVVGTFALLIMDNIGHMGASSAIIEDVAVDPEFQNSGIGQSMMGYAFEKAQQNGCYKVMLSANLKRKLAHTFYESLGFEKHGYSYKLDC
jgi:GNAT superfamily N-acetyltransferase